MQTLSRLAVLISGRGTNLKAIQSAIERGLLLAKIVVVISSDRSAPGLVIAEDAGIATEVVSSADCSDREHYDRVLLTTLEPYQPDWVLLAGFMRKLSPLFVQRYCGKMVNIHPSLLPKYPGFNTHQRVLASADSEHGCSVHFVTEALDAGPVIAQARLHITPNDTVAGLKQRVQLLEYELYWRSVSLVVGDNVVFRGGRAWSGKQCLPETGMVIPLDE